MRTTRLIAGILLSVLGSSLNSTALSLPPPALNPTKYGSPSGKFVCEVDPTDLYGRGEGNYRIAKDGELAWQGAKPFTLYEAAITDDGIVVGYAYTHGLEGFSTNGWKGGMGEFHIVIMRSNGELVLDEVVKRERSRFLHARPNPLAKGLLVDTAKDLFVVRLSDPDLNRRTEVLRGFRLSTGKETPVTGASLESPTARTPVCLPQAAGSRKSPELASFPIRPVKLLGTFAFQESGATNSPAIRNVVCFDLDARGNIGFIRRESAQQFTFVQVAPGGDVLSEIILPIPGTALTNDSPKVAWLKEDQWVVTASDRGVGGRAFGGWLDIARSDFNAIPGFASPPIQKIVGSRDGGFVALVTTRHQYSMEDELIAFDEAGKIRWRVKKDYNSGDGALFSPEDVAVTTSGEVAVLDNIRKKVQMFGANGDFVKGLDLAKIWGRKPNYPTEIAADNAGGFLIKDFNGTPPLVWMNAEGKVASQFTPKHSDGRIIDTVSGIKVSANGRVWVSDGECLIRLAEDGVADLVLGDAPKETTLGKVAALTVDQRARLYAVDERSGAVHVFDRNGSRLRVCNPDVADFSGKLFLPEVSASSAGEVYLSEGRGSSDELQFIHFGSDGQRLGTKRFDLDTVKQELHALPDGGQLVVGYHDAYLLDRDAKVRRTIQRRPDRNWLEHPERASVAPDGSVAIVTGRAYGTEPWQVNLYSSSGDPIRTIEMPVECRSHAIAYSGKHLVTVGESGIFLLSTTGEPVLKFSPSIDGFESEYWNCFVTGEGRELWLASAQRKAVWRYELPQ